MWGLTMSDADDDLAGWTHTLATLREINERLPFAHPIQVAVDDKEV
jgi:hypothetical protein